jgi:folate-binding protein YgfZ
MIWSQQDQEIYTAARQGVTWSELSALGKIAVRGADRFSWLQGMVSNDIRLLESGAPSLQAYVLDATGHILAETTALTMAEAEPFLLLLVARENVKSLYGLLDRLLIMEEVELEDVTEEYDVLSLQGALAEPRNGFGTWIAADHTGSGAWDCVGTPESIAGLKSALMAEGIPEMPSSVWEVLRIEAGIPAYPAELNSQIIASEAGNAATHICLTKGCYVGQEILARIDSRGHTNRALTCLQLSSLPESSSEIRLIEPTTGRDVGWITSLVPFAPSTQSSLALGYVRHEQRTVGTLLQMSVGGTVQVISPLS